MLAIHKAVATLFYKSHIQGEIERIMRLKDKEMEGKGQMREKKTCIHCKL